VERDTPESTGQAYARVGLLGNPSDAYGGVAVAFTLGNFAARVTVSPAPTLEIEDELAAPLLDAALRRYHTHTSAPAQPLRIALHTEIPFQAGLAGSSAIVIAALRAFGTLHGIPLGPFDQSELALAVEVEDLGIAAGPMDRVIQAWGGLLHMDFSRPRQPSSYTALPVDWLPPMLIAWDPQGGSSSHSVHSDVRERWQRGDPEVRAQMARFHEIVEAGTRAIRARDARALRAAVDRNFDARAQLFPIGERDQEMVAIARGHGAAAKQCGSGGACLAVLERPQDRDALAAKYTAAGYRTGEPQLSPAEAPAR